MRSLLINELEISPKRLIKILNYDGKPITANKIKNEIESEFESNLRAKSKTSEFDFKIRKELTIFAPIY